MRRKVLFLIFIIIATTVICYIDYGIKKYAYRLYSGKDNGLIVRFESICFLSTFYFLIMSQQKRILMALIGLLIGVIVGVLFYLFISLFGTYDFVYQIGSCFVFMFLFLPINNLLAKS